MYLEPGKAVAMGKAGQGRLGLVFLLGHFDHKFKSMANTFETLHILLEVCRLLPSDHESPHSEKFLCNAVL